MILFTTSSGYLYTRLYTFCGFKPANMWFKCVICHQTYSHKCNLKRHMDTAQMHKVHRCNLCEKEFKRREYLTRHLKQAHKTPAIQGPSARLLTVSQLNNHQFWTFPALHQQVTWMMWTYSSTVWRISPLKHRYLAPIWYHPLLPLRVPP